MDSEQIIMNSEKIIIYCGGKCGSSTLYNTFSSNKYHCIHTHGHISEIENLEDKIYIIDSYRDPIERKISSFFQNICSHLNKSIEDIKNIHIEYLIKIFNDNYLLIPENYNPLDIDYPIFNNTEFDFVNEYSIKTMNNRTFIKLRFKKINFWNNILSKIFKKKIDIYPDNLSKNKDYSHIYNSFKKKYKVPISILNYIYKFDKLFNKYNTKEEKHYYYKYWLNKCYNDNNMFNIPKNFDPNEYIKINNLNIKTEIEALVYYVNNNK